MANLNMNMEDVKAYADFELLPPGNYDVRIVDSEISELTNGVQLILKMEIFGGEFSGVPMQDRIWLQHSNDKAAEMGVRKLKAVAVAIKHSNPNYLRDSEELHGGEMTVRVTLRDYDDKNGEKRQSNDIKGYSPVGKAIPMPTSSASAPQTAAAPGRRPWEKAA